MRFTFKAKIFKVGINPCVKVPFRITDKMTARKGFIPVKGKINGHEFKQTLVPVKDEQFRLYVNSGMLRGSTTKPGDMASFIIEQGEATTRTKGLMPVALAARLKQEGLAKAFNQLIPSRQKEIIRYLNLLKTDDTRERNIERIIKLLKNPDRRKARWY